MEDQLSRLREYEEAIYQFKPHLEELERINQQIQESFVFENRYTQYTMETLRVGWEQLVTSGIYSFFDRKLYYQRSFELEYLANYSKGRGIPQKWAWFLKRIAEYELNYHNFSCFYDLVVTTRDHGICK